MLSGNYNIQGLFFKIQWLFALEFGYDYLYQRLLVVLYFTHVISMARCMTRPNSISCALNSRRFG